MKKLIVLILFSSSLYSQNTGISSIQPANATPSQEEVFTIVEEMPEFPGGRLELDKFVQDSLKYPEDAKKNGITGKCFLKFIVEKNGSLGNAEVLKGVPGCAECDKEAVRLIKIMPKWKPGKQSGHLVRCYYVMPVNFKLSN